MRVRVRERAWVQSTINSCLRFAELSDDKWILLQIAGPANICYREMDMTIVFVFRGVTIHTEHILRARLMPL